MNFIKSLKTISLTLLIKLKIQRYKTEAMLETKTFKNLNFIINTENLEMTLSIYIKIKQDMNLRIKTNILKNKKRSIMIKKCNLVWNSKMINSKMEIKPANCLKN